MKFMFATEDWTSIRTCIRGLASRGFERGSWCFALWLITCLHTDFTLGEEKADKGLQPEVASVERDDDKTVAFVGGDVFTCAPGSTGVQADYEKGVILVRGGKIAEVGGAELEIPDGAEKVDCTGLSLFPGMVDVSSVLWLTDRAKTTSGSDASLHVEDGIDPFSEDWREVAAQGVTAVYLQPASNGTTGGFGALFSTVPVANEDSELVAPRVIVNQVGLQASLGVGARNNRSRSQQFARIQKLFAGVKSYGEKWVKYNEYLKKKEDSEKEKESAGKKSAKAQPDKIEAGKDKPGKARAGVGRGRVPPRGRVRPSSGGGEPGKRGDSGATTEASEKEKSKSDEGAKKPSTSNSKSEKAPEKPDKDPVKEKLLLVLKGDVPLRLRLSSADDLYYARKLAKEFESIKWLYEGLDKLGSAAVDFASEARPVALGPWFNAASDDVIQDWVRTFANHQGVLAIGSFGNDARGSKFLRHHAATAVATGLSVEKALRGVTLDAARFAGASESLGSLEVGKLASVVAVDGHLLDSSAPIHWVYASSAFLKMKSSEGVRPGKLVDAFEDETELPGISGQRFAIRSKNVLSKEGDWQPATLMIAEGKIVGVAEYDVVSDWRIIDLGDRCVTPGLYSAATTLGVSSLVDPDVQSDAGYVAAADALAGSRKQDRKRARQGLLRVLLMPGSQNVVAGSAALLGLGSSVEVLEREAGTKFALVSQARSTTRFPASLTGQVQLIEDAFAGKTEPNRLYLPDSILAALARKSQLVFDQLRARERVAFFEVDSDAEIRSALELIEKYELNAALVNAKQLKPFIERLKELKVTIVARPSSVMDFDWYIDDLCLASREGVDICFAADNAADLRLTASLAVNAGMDRSKALRAITSGPWKLVEPSTLVADSPADFIVWDGSPLNIASKPEVVLVGGNVLLSEDEAAQEMGQ